MRKIKFRVWDQKNKRFLDWKTEVKYSVAAVSVSEGHLISFFGFALDSPHHDVQQYTGFKDKNGKEIYEGDILAYREDNGELATSEVKWENGCWLVYGMPLVDCLIAGEIEDEIIGNIFENE